MPASILCKKWYSKVALRLTISGGAFFFFLSLMVLLSKKIQKGVLKHKNPKSDPLANRF
jgi:hypothetical protein